MVITYTTDINMHELALGDQAQSLTGTYLLREEEIVASAEPIPDFCGVYFLIADGRIQYIGQSTNVISRIQSHITGNSHVRMSKPVEAFAWVRCRPEHLDALEALYVFTVQPPGNGRRSPRFGDGFNTNLSLREILAGCVQASEDRYNRLIATKDKRRKWRAGSGEEGAAARGADRGVA